MADWYYARNDKKMGPVSQAELMDLAADGTLRPSDLVWTEGMKDWARADEVKGFTFPRNSAAETGGRNGPRDSVSASRPGRSAATRDFDNPRPRRTRYEDNDDDDDRPRRRSSQPSRYSSLRQPKSGANTLLVVLLCVGGSVAGIILLGFIIALVTNPAHELGHVPPPQFVLNQQPFIPPQQPIIPPQQPFQMPQIPAKKFQPLPGQKTSVEALPIRLNEKTKSRNDRLALTDAVDIDAPGSFCKVYTYPMVSGRTYVIDLESRDFDAYLRLEDPDGLPLLEDDDGGGNLNARISYTPNRTGLFRIITTSLEDGKVGSYLLKVTPSNGNGQMAPPPFEPQIDAPPPQVKNVPKLKSGILVVKNGFGVVGERLTVDDPRDTVHKNSPCKILPVQLEAGTVYEFRMSGKDLKVRELRVRIEDSEGKVLASSKVSPSARVSFTPTQAGEYLVIATSSNGTVGSFSIIVTTRKN